MKQALPRSTRTDTLFPDATLFRSRPQAQAGGNEDGREIRAGEKSRETGGEEGNAEKANGHDREEDLETGGEEVLTDHAGAPAAHRAESIGRWTSSSPPCACSGSPAKSGSSGIVARSEEHTSELQSLMRTSYAV